MMKASHTNITTAAAALFAAGALNAGEPLEVGSVSLAPDPGPPPSSWNFEAILYGWFTGLKGDTGFNGNIANVDIGFDDILDNLDFAAFGAIGAHNGTWGVFLDGMYTKLSTSGEINGALFKKVDISVWSGMGNLYGGYRLVDNPGYTMDVIGGARLTYSKTKLRFQENLAPSDLSGSDSEAWVDAVAGVKGRWTFAERWFLTYLADVGGGSSDLTWRAVGTLGYQLNEMWDIQLGYQYLDTEYEKGDQDFVYDVKVQGIVLGLGIRW